MGSFAKGSTLNDLDLEVKVKGQGHPKIMILSYFQCFKAIWGLFLIYKVTFKA